MSASAAGDPRDPLDRLLASDVRLPGPDARAFEDALRGILARHPEVRGAAVYPVARGEAVVRVVTASAGWTPVLVRAHERSDGSAIERRLEDALGRVRIR
jgi:hypothetical protein